MFLFSLSLHLICFWFIQPYGPWLALIIPAVAIALKLPLTLTNRLQIAAAAGLSWSALAAGEDMRNADLVSKRLAGLLHLPNDFLIFPIFGLVIALTSLAIVQAAAQFYRPRANLS